MAMFTSVASERVDNQQRTSAPRLSIARSRPELESAFRLVYRSYVRAGLQEPNNAEMRLVPHHLLPSTEVMIATLNGATISTASLIVDSHLGLPAESMYGEEIDAFRNSGMKLAEVGCLADRRDSAARFIQMFRELSKLVAQAAVVRGCDALIAATHPRHARFYVRHLGFQQIGGLRDCPYVKGNPAVPLLLDLTSSMDPDVKRRLFGERYSSADLAVYRWANETDSYFRKILYSLNPEAKAMLEPRPIPQ